MADAPFDEKFQNRILALMIRSDHFLKTVRILFPPELFEASEQSILCDIIYQFFDQYGQAPGDYLDREIEKYMESRDLSEDREELFEAVLEKVRSTRVTGRDEKYLQEEIVRFARHEKVRSVLEDFIPRHNRGVYDLDSFLESMEEISAVGSSTNDVGVNYFESLQQRINRRADRIESQNIATLIDYLDKTFYGIKSQQLGTVMAPSGIGKSWMLNHLSKAALMQGKTVFQYSGEMSIDEVCDRYDQSVIGARADDLSTARVQRKLKDGIARLQNWGGDLILKWLSESSTVQSIREHIDHVYQETGLHPDLIVVDYGDLLVPAGKHLSAYTGDREIWHSLRSVAVDYDAAVWTATQASRQAFGSALVTDRETADSIWKVRESDIFITFNQGKIFDPLKREWKKTGEGFKENEVRMFVAKHRGRPSRYTVEFLSDYEHGKFYDKKSTDIWMIERRKEKKSKRAKGKRDRQSRSRSR